MTINNAINSNQMLDSSSSPNFVGLNLSSLATYSVAVTDSSSNVVSDAGFGYNSLGGPLLSLSTSVGGNNSALFLSASGSPGNCYIEMNRGDTTGKCFINFETNGGGPSGDRWWIGLTNTGTHNFFILDVKAGTTPFAITQSTGIVNIPSLAASQAVVADASKNLTSLGYGSSNTASTLVERDGSGNFSAGTITATGVNLSGLTASDLVATDSSKNLTSSVSSLSPTFTGLTLSGLTQGSVIFAGASGSVSQDNSDFFWDNTNKNLYIGANTSTTLDSPGRIVIRGTQNSVTNGSDIIFYNTADSHPLMQILPWQHDGIYLGFDAYWNGSNWISSFSSSSYGLFKNGSVLKIVCATASQGSTITWTNAVTIDSSGDTHTNNLKIDTVGKTLYVKEGTNACKGTVTLSGASTVVNTTAVATGDMIILALAPAGGTPGVLSYTINNGVSFTITSSTGILDTSTVKWLIVKAA